MHERASSPGGRQLLVVAGSGRSGTSLIAGLAQRLGVHIPKPEVSADRSNPRGFGEPRWLVDYHNELLALLDVTIEDGRPEAWELTDALAGQPQALDPLVGWLETQFDTCPRLVVKDPRLGWFIELHRAAAQRLGADLRVATMLRHPAEVLRSREVAYGTRTNNTTRSIGWLTMMLGLEQRTRDLPRATIRYDDLLAGWRAALGGADATLGMRLLDHATPDQLAEADDLVDPSLRRSTVGWEGVGIPPRTLDLVTRAYQAYDRLVGVPADDQGEARADLDALWAELTAYFDESYDVARNRTGAFARSEKRRVRNRVRQEMRSAAETSDGPLVALSKRAKAKLRGTP
jgi:hypothetical protein